MLLQSNFISPHFKFTEFNCKDGTAVPIHYLQNMYLLVYVLEYLRGYFKAPITITSAYRTVAHNKAVGGATNSFHLRCEAVDFKVKGVTPKAVFQTLQKLMAENDIPKGGIILYNNFVHYDIRGHMIVIDNRTCKSCQQ